MKTEREFNYHTFVLDKIYKTKKECYERIATLRKNMEKTWKGQRVHSQRIIKCAEGYALYVRSSYKKTKKRS